MIQRRGRQVEKAEVLQNFVRLFDSAPRLQVRNVVDLTFTVHPYEADEEQ
jgi:hypothetical protein